MEITDVSIKHMTAFNSIHVMGNKQAIKKILGQKSLQEYMKTNLKGGAL